MSDKENRLDKTNIKDSLEELDKKASEKGLVKEGTFKGDFIKELDKDLTRADKTNINNALNKIKNAFGNKYPSFDKNGKTYPQYNYRDIKDADINSAERIKASISKYIKETLTESVNKMVTCNSCSVICSGNCSKECFSCSNLCTGSCNNNCINSCSLCTSCKGCNSGCTGCTGCTGGCGNGCSNGCGNGCSGGCGGDSTT